MSKHTPGPWRMVDHSWSDTTIYGGDSNEIASLSIRSIATEKTQQALEEVQTANAKLITAAPELLEALCALRGDIRDHELRTALPLSGGPLKASWDKATEIIEKATR